MPDERESIEKKIKRFSENIREIKGGTVNTQPDGSMIAKYTDGASYRGRYKLKKRSNIFEPHGKDIYQTKGLGCFNGEFQFGKIHGHGRFFFNNEFVVTGFFEAGDLIEGGFNFSNGNSGVITQKSFTIDWHDRPENTASPYDGSSGFISGQYYTADDNSSVADSKLYDAIPAKVVTAYESLFGNTIEADVKALGFTEKIKQNLGVRSKLH